MTRQELRHQGEAMLRTLFGSTTQPAGLANLLTDDSARRARVVHRWAAMLDEALAEG